MNSEIKRGTIVRRKIEKSDDTRLNILHTAFELFLCKGYEATTIRMICNQTGIEAPTIYYYFKSKKGLFFAVVDEILTAYQALFSKHFGHQIYEVPHKLNRTYYIYTQK